MKIALITRHAITNYGSLLQAFATQKVIEGLGHSCEIIDYIREDESYWQIEKTILQKKHQWNDNPVKKAIYLAVRQPACVAAGKRFEQERRKYLKLTRRYTSEEQLSREKPAADLYMTGSDQVWGPTGNGTYDGAYCLSFANDGERCVAYAASFGHADLTPELKIWFGKRLRHYQKITVREDSAVQLLQSMGIHAEQVLDPTLLLDAAFWNRYTKPIREKNYILIYQIHNDQRIKKYADKIAKETGMQVVRVSASFHQISRGGKFVWCPEVGRFLSYIKNARLIITDSFHGTAFAINFNVPFVEIMPQNHTETRNMSILALTGLSDRALINDDDTALAHRNIDFVDVNEKIEKRRAESLEQFKKIIEMQE